MLRPLVLLLALAPTGCDQVFGLKERSPDAPPPPDAIDAPGTMADAQHCFGSGTLCLVDPPPAELRAEVGTTLTLDTTPGALTSRCAAYTGGESDLCVVGVTRLQVDGVLQGIGTRPLVLVASTVVITGTVSVASIASPMVTGAGAQPPECSIGTGAAAMSPGGGGAGGTFGGRGGNGGSANGVTNAGTAGTVQPSPTKLRGGCNGRSGSGTSGLAGRGGGALAILTPSLTLDGRITASGGGGAGGSPTAPTAANGNGGSGAGSGGMIVIDAASFVIGTGASVFANGGGGGEGGGVPSAGNPGENATDAAVAAAGGTGGTALGGAGGAGSVGTDLTGNNGRTGMGTSGGGGGSGGAGVIRFVTSPPANAVVSPPPS